MRVNRRLIMTAAVSLLAGLSIGPRVPKARTLTAGPSDYLTLLGQLRPGDELRLTSGIYREGLALKALHGAAEFPISIGGPSDRSAIFVGQPGRNTIELRDVSHLQIRNLTLDGRNTPRIDGVKSHDVTHHITLENLEIINYATHQQTVGISTKAPAWNWVIRNNVIRGAGTGLYLGDSNGTAPFIHGLIERNLISDTIGYGLQIKHQIPRPEIAGMPSQPGSTLIRHNIISKARQPRSGFQGPRPNLLVGHFPPRAAGVEDTYEIYGNLLYQNLVEQPLFQGEGNIAFYSNLLINHHGDGIWIQPHNDLPRRIAVFSNTVLARGLGISVRGGYPGIDQEVVGNAVFAERPIESSRQRDNFTAAFAAAEDHLMSPFGQGDELDLRPLPGRLQSASLALEPVGRFTDADKDFAGSPRDGTTRGAYAGAEVPREGPLAFPPTF
jgi:hypothetical protein